MSQETNESKREFYNLFTAFFQNMQKDVHQTAIDKGWYGEDGADKLNVGERIALMHSELSEALEAWRQGNPPDDKIPEFSGLEAELADVVIRIMDFAEREELKVADAIVAKSEYNKTRAYRHGGKKA